MSFKDLLVFVDALPGGDERLDLAVALEGAFGVSIPFVDINNQHFHSVNALEAYLRVKMA